MGRKPSVSLSSVAESLGITMEGEPSDAHPRENLGVQVLTTLKEALVAYQKSHGYNSLSETVTKLLAKGINFPLPADLVWQARGEDPKQQAARKAKRLELDRRIKATTELLAMGLSPEDTRKAQAAIAAMSMERAKL